MPDREREDTLSEISRLVTAIIAFINHTNQPDEQESYTEEKTDRSNAL